MVLVMVCVRLYRRDRWGVVVVIEVVVRRRLKVWNTRMMPCCQSVVMSCVRMYIHHVETSY